MMSSALHRIRVHDLRLLVSFLLRSRSILAWELLSWSLACVDFFWFGGLIFLHLFCFFSYTCFTSFFSVLVGSCLVNFFFSFFNGIRLEVPLVS